jgi:hypothetical protein
MNVACQETIAAAVEAVEVTNQSSTSIIQAQQHLIFVQHCARCKVADGLCRYGAECTVVKALLKHAAPCQNSRCVYPNCSSTRKLLHHVKRCTSKVCPLCENLRQSSHVILLDNRLKDADARIAELNSVIGALTTIAAGSAATRSAATFDASAPEHPMHPLDHVVRHRPDINIMTFIPNATYPPLDTK